MSEGTVGVATEFIAVNLWTRITKLARRAPGEVAVAYCARGARKLLPLKRGSRLVVDASERAVKAGQTDPAELLYFINRGVEIHSSENLHAKVFVFGDMAIVGSMNVSRRSAAVLQEAAVVTSDRGVVAAARRFVAEQLGEEVSAEHARRLKKLYRPPQLGPGQPADVQRRPRKPAAPKHQTLWIVPLFTRDWDEDEHREAKRARPAAQQRIRAGREKLDEFAFEGVFCDQLQEGHLVLQVVRDGRQRYAVQAAHVIRIRRFQGAGGKPRMIVFLAARLHSHRKHPAALRKVLGARQRVLPKGEDARLVRDPAAAHALLNLWATR